MKIVKYLDSTLINPKVKINDYINLVETALKYNFRGVVVPTFALDYIKSMTKGSTVLTSAVVDFPLGLSSYYSRLKDIEFAANHYANEIDLVINPIYIRMGKLGSIEDELMSINENFHIAVKAIIDFGLVGMTFDGNIVKEISNMVGVSHIKTGTGYFDKAYYGVTEQFKNACGNKKLKVAGGIYTLQSTLDFITSGADVIGTSHAEDIIKESIDENIK